jgi:hypothetical protein
MPSLQKFLNHGADLNIFLLSYLYNTELGVNLTLDFHTFFKTIQCTSYDSHIASIFSRCDVKKLADSKAGVPYLVECDSETFVLKQIPYPSNQRVTPSLIPTHTNLGCYSDTNITHANMYSLGSEGFLNEYLIGILVEYTLRKSRSLNFLPFYRGFYCKGNGYILMKRVEGDCSSISSLKQLTRSVLLSILLQFSKTLLILKNSLSFSHNDMKLKNLFFEYLTTKPHQWDRDIPWENIVVKFADFDKSTCVVQNINQPIFIHPTKKILDKLPNFVLSSLSTPLLTTDNNSAYTVKYGTNLMVFNSRNSKRPYYKSFDFYVFVTSMLFNSDYLNAIVDDHYSSNTANNSQTGSLLTNFLLPLYGYTDRYGGGGKVESFLTDITISEKNTKRSDSVTPAMKFLQNKKLSCTAIEDSIDRLLSMV